jgi:glutaminase
MAQKHVEWFPMQHYLEDLHARLARLAEGEVASYIPELALARPEWFGIALVTVDGNVYQVGDAREPFTVQSISKAITYGIALEDNGIDDVFNKVGVEPSGEAFNSISLEPETGRPLNPMINAGAIATTGLINGKTAEERLARILHRFEQYTGHPVTVNEAVYRSERDTGHRNRAIAHLLRNAEILTGMPEEVLDVYFKQCSIDVTARDLALMGACLANSGVNPITGVVALDKRHAEKVLSVMSTCGMYDYSGNWIFSVGMPAKSGVGGGIMAVLPGQFGLGVFSPPLDRKGNSIRGIRVCEDLSRDFGLHLFKVARATSSSVLRVTYNASSVNSRRVRNEGERAILLQHGEGIRVFELQGELMFGSTDSVIKTMLEGLQDTGYVILDFRRVVEVDSASARLLADLCVILAQQGKQLFFTGTGDNHAFRRYLAKQATGVNTTELLRFADSDRALEWCEDEVIRELDPALDVEAQIPVEGQYLCDGLDAEDIARLCRVCRKRVFHPGEVIFHAGDRGECFYLVASGLVDVVVKGQDRKERRLVTMRSGMSVGEFAMVTNQPRSAEARAVVETTCYEVGFEDIEEDLKARLLVNLGKELARRLSKEAQQFQAIGGEE